MNKMKDACILLMMISVIPMTLLGCRQKQIKPSNANAPRTNSSSAQDEVTETMPSQPAKKLGHVIGNTDGVEQILLDEKKAITMLINYGNPIIISSMEGKKYELHISKPENDAAELKQKYVWKALAENQKSGSGILYESIGVSSSGTSYINAPKSQCMIMIENLALRWSSGGTHSYQLQYLPEMLEISAK